MKKTHIFILVFVVAAVGVIISLFANTSTYTDFSAAVANPGKEFHVIGKLNEEEGEGADIPFCPPVIDHGRKQLAVLYILPGVIFSLVPDSALDGKVDQRMDHSVVQQGRIAVRTR